MGSSRHRQDLPPADDGLPALNEEQRMLLRLRDELYEGQWNLFVKDLEARLAGEPHVFEIGPASGRLAETIAAHLRLIEDLRAMEAALGVDLSGQAQQE